MLRFISRVVFLAVSCFPAVVCAQGITITGRIVDAETLDPMPYAHVFVDQTTIGAVSNIDGEYVIENMLPGNYKLVFSYVGYELYYENVAVASKNIRVSIRLIPQKEMLQAVEVKGSKDKEWEKQLKQFREVFFGTGSIAKECKILNPWVLDFTYDSYKKELKATASAPLQIENNALGYNIECVLQGFTFEKKSYKIRGLYKFEEQNTLDEKVASKWTRNRKQIHLSSMRFILKSILENHEAENGFKLYNDKRPHLNSLGSGYFSNELGKNVFDIKIKDHMSPMGQPGNYKIAFDGRLEIHHTTMFTNTKVYRDVSHPVSWVECEKGYLLVASNGHLINNEDVITYGELNTNRIAAMLPVNYSPGSMVVVNYITKRKIAKRLQERVHVQTDKGFYYPGEKMWLKAYLNYENPSVRDSMSQVLYLDIIDSEKKIVLSKMLKVDSTTAIGDITLPAQWPPGVYRLRAYTNWMKNYGHESFFQAPLAIMNPDERLSATRTLSDPGDFKFAFDKRKFGKGEKLELQILLDSANENFLARASMSISLAGHGLFPTTPEIKESHFFPEDLPTGTLADFVYPVEYGFSLTGRLYRPKKRNTAGEMTVIKGTMDSLYSVTTDSKGLFKIENLSFFDTVRFSFQARDRKGRIFGITEIIPSDPFPVSISPLKVRNNLFDTLAIPSPVKFLSVVPADSVDESKGREPVSKTTPTDNSGFDYSISGEELLASVGNQNIMQALQGRVPGFQLNTSTGRATFRGSSNQDNEPLFLVDGIPLYTPNSSSSANTVQPVVQATSSESNATTQGESTITVMQNPSASAQDNSMQTSSAASMLGHLMVDGVSRVEVNSRADARYGSMGAYGVISITTKKGYSKGKDVKTFDVFMVDGFVRPSRFIPPDESIANFTGDYIPTIYWNNDLNLSARTATKISFVCPTRPGNYTARIEAISAEGKPLSGAFTFSVGR
jgi:CarboxypepD_reg-like domain/TonB-dependent Receptor Plug Domain